MCHASRVHPPMDALAVVSDGLGVGRPSAVRSLFPADRCPGEESLDHGRLFFNRSRNAHTVPHRACAGPRSRQARGGAPSPRIRPGTGGRLSFDDGRSDRFEVMARGGFDLHFPDDQLNTFSCVSWTFGCRL